MSVIQTCEDAADSVCELWTKKISHFHPRNFGLDDFEQTHNITACRAPTEQTVVNSYVRTSGLNTEMPEKV